MYPNQLHTQEPEGPEQTLKQFGLLANQRRISCGGGPHGLAPEHSVVQSSGQSFLVPLPEGHGAALYEHVVRAHPRVHILTCQMLVGSASSDWTPEVQAATSVGAGE